MEYLQPVGMIALIIGSIIIAMDNSAQVSNWPFGLDEWVATAGMVLAIAGFIGIGISVA
jgi:hypothetical protein